MAITSVQRIGARRARLAVAACALSMATGCFLFPREEKMLAPPVLARPVERSFITVPVEVGSIALAATGSARFEPKTVVDQYFEDSGGRVRSVFVSVGDTVREAAPLAELHTGTLEDRIALQELSLEKLKLRRDLQRLAGATPLELDIADLDVQSEEIRLRMLRREMESSILRASAGGKVVYLSSALQPGSTIAAYQPLLRIADPGRLALRYTGGRIYDFYPGAVVEVRIKELTLAGVVTESPVTMPVDADEAQRRTVTIEVARLPSVVQSGDIAQITLLLDAREGVLIVPRDAVREYLGRKYVYVLEDDTRQERTVETGIQTETAVEIVKGLDEGELVILR